LSLGLTALTTEEDEDKGYKHIFVNATKIRIVIRYTCLLIILQY